MNIEFYALMRALLSLVRKIPQQTQLLEIEPVVIGTDGVVRQEQQFPTETTTNIK